MKMVKVGDKFILQSKYEELATIHRIKGLLWDRGSKVWWTKYATSAARYVGVAEMDEDLFDELKSGAEDYREEQIQQTAAIEASRATDADIEIPVPDDLEYMPFQKAGIAFALDRKNTLIADEMGLGKTIQALGMINSIPSIKKVLVIVPASLKLNWEAEAEKWLTRKFSIGVVTPAGIPTGRNFLIINYDVLKKFKVQLMSRAWDLVIIDEGHYIKNAKAQRTKAAIAIAKKIGRKVILTGTPIVNRPVELFTMLNLLDPKSWPRFTRFAFRYCGPKNNGWGWEFKGASNLEELQEKLRSTIMIRRMKEEVLKDLAPKIRQVIEIEFDCVELAEEQKAALKWDEIFGDARIAIDAAKTDEEYAEAVAKMAEFRKVYFEEMAILRHDTAVAKAPFVANHIKEALENVEKIVVFAHHRDVVKILQEELKDYNPVSLVGGMKDTEKKAAVDAFQNDSDVRVFIGSLMAAKEGITLTAASTVVFAELDWVPGNMSQAEDRCHRITQEDSVLVHHIVLAKSFDSKLAKSVIEKQKVIEKALNEKSPKVEIEPLVEVKNVESKPEKVVRSKFSKKKLAALHRMLRFLAGRDMDYALHQNGIGYNGRDSGFGHSLAEREATLTDKQAAAAIRMLRKYKRQLEGPDYDLIYPVKEKVKK